MSLSSLSFAPVRVAVALGLALALGSALGSTAASGAQAESAVPAGRVGETELVAGLLARDAARERTELRAASREAASLARLSEPSWNVEALREASTSRQTEFTTEVLSVGLGLELTRRNAAERRRALTELKAEELALRAELLDAVSDMRLLALEAWQAQRESEALRSGQDEVESLVAELTRLVEAGEHSRFDLDRLRLTAATHEGRARMALAAARSSLARLSALSGRSVGDVELEEQQPLGTGEEIVELALEAHPILESLRRHLEAGELGLGLAAQSHPGLLDLRAAYRRDDAPGVSPGDGYEVELSYTLPSRALRRLAGAQAQSVRSERALAVARAELRVAAEVEAAVERLLSLEASGPLSEADTEGLRGGSVRRYRAGESTMTELVDVLAGLEERALQVIAAEAARRRARLELDRATGLATAPELAALVAGELE